MPGFCKILLTIIMPPEVLKLQTRFSTVRSKPRLDHLVLARRRPTLRLIGKEISVRWRENWRRSRQVSIQTVLLHIPACSFEFYNENFRPLSRFGSSRLKD